VPVIVGKRLIHIADTNDDLKWEDKEYLETFFEEQHAGFIKMKELAKSLTTSGGKHIAFQAISRTDFVQDGFVNDKGKINFFRWNNAYLDERLKMLYLYPTQLHKAYSQSEAFKVYTESTFCSCTEQELQEIRSNNTRRPKKIKMLYAAFLKLKNSLTPQDLQIFEELKDEFSTIFEAFEYIGYQRIRELEFSKPKIEEEVEAVKLKEKLTAKKVKADVYSIFQEGKRYATSFINDELKKIFDKHNISLGRGVKGADIGYYFEIEVDDTRESRGWKLIRKLID